MLATGCAVPASDSESLPAVRVLHEAAFCAGGEGRRAEWLADASAYQSLWQRTVARVPPEGAPAVDFSRWSVLYLADAQRPSAGAGFRFVSWRFEPAAGDATLQVSLEGAAGYQAQVITRPCLFLALPRGAYHRVTVIDQDGRIWAGVARP